MSSSGPAHVQLRSSSGPAHVQLRSSSRPAHVQPTSSSGPAHVQPTSSSGPAHVQPTSSSGPAHVQPTSSPRPAQVQLTSSPRPAQVQLTSSPRPAHVQHPTITSTQTTPSGGSSSDIITLRIPAAERIPSVFPAEDLLEECTRVNGGGVFLLHFLLRFQSCCITYHRSSCQTCAASSSRPQCDRPQDARPPTRAFTTPRTEEDDTCSVQHSQGFLFFISELH
ncbi:uncharacterized protein DDB_G0284671-like isoform X2 [Toxotes jaculatrix]|uniref:uncharacterized protein DDB_G0284671-like isoform X2 n=1 Tax=Toxotes jaculatrix TaxID=941984 RepID=UPI001B3A9166|nr:uncharacterized protein DDB_G0284671-like isoform X2 [Toxotes jaculatrix]